MILKAIATRAEVACLTRGRPSYRWATRYILVNPETGNREFPAVTRAEVFDRARELGAEIEWREDAWAQS